MCQQVAGWLDLPLNYLAKTQKTLDTFVMTGNVTEAIKKIKEESKTLYTFLFNAEALYFGDEIELVLSNETAYKKIATDEGKKYLSELFTNIQGEKLKVVVSKKGNLKERFGKGASIYDLAAKKDILGDKMTIIED